MYDMVNTKFVSQKADTICICSYVICIFNANLCKLGPGMCKTAIVGI